MLRRRIFSSAMASVMALTSVAVVAQAEDAQYKSKADLEKLVNETYGDAFRNGELGDYGTISAENVLAALEAADAILLDSDADEDDYTTAYKMVEATVARLKIYTAEELKALIASCTSIYESNNIYNEDLGDLIYDAGTYQKLLDAYDDAEGVVDSSSSADITDAYEALDAAKGGLKKLTVVSKSMFRTALKEYEALIADQYKYESWRLGNVEGWADLSTGNFWALQGKPMAYGTLIDNVLAIGGAINEKYEAFDNIKTLNKTSSEEIVQAYNAAKDAVAIAKAWKVDSITKATKSGVKNLLDKYHGHMVYEFCTTSAEDLLTDIVAKAGKNDKGQSNISYEAVSKTDGTVDLVVYGEETGDERYGYWNVSEISFSAENWAWITRVIDAGLTIKTAVKLYIPVKDGVYDTTRQIVAGDAPANYSSKDWKLISANTKYDISNLIPVTQADVEGAVSNAYTDLKFTTFNEFKMNAGTMAIQATADPDLLYNVDFERAFDIANDYLNENYSRIGEIDDAGVVVDGAKGNSKEWALVYRYLYYAIQDRYDGSVGAKYTKADVQKLIDDAYNMAELTGDAAIFAESHNDVVYLRQYAVDWLRKVNSNKKYKDYNAGYSSNGEFYEDSTTMYTMLADGCDLYDANWTLIEHLEGVKQLTAEYEAMKYSFGDVYERIAEVCAMIDDGDLEGTTELLAAIDNTAYYLSTVSNTIYTAVESWATYENEYYENEAFSVDREFLPYNRVITSEGGTKIATLGQYVKITGDGTNTSHWNLAKALESLEAEVTKQLAPAAKLGDVNGDGLVNALDAAAILKAAVGVGTVDAAVADFNADGAVNALDAAAILKAVVDGTV